MMDLTYKTKRCGSLTDSEFEQCAALFSNHYGKYSGKGDFSEQQLKEAYERMDMANQPWTQGTSREIDFIEDFMAKGVESEILDLGCGQGRHCIELSSRGYGRVSGVDFSERNIRKASASAKEKVTAPMFFCADARKLKLGRKFDVVLCLYDVVGSFRLVDDNIRILKTVKQHLKKGGRAFVSVMNMELTDSIAIHKTSLKENPQEILRMLPSDTMLRTGDVFKPEHYLINTDDGLVYRKEQFHEDDMISAEYLVTDKRYTMAEFEGMAKSLGFRILQKRYVQTGHFDTPLSATDKRAKEILFVMAI